MKAGVLIAWRLLVFIAACSVVPAFAAGTTLKAPEDAIRAYLDGVAHRDFDAILSSTAVVEMSAGFDFVGNVDRFRVLTPDSPAPATDPLYVAINKATFTGKIAGQVKFLAYGLLSTSDVANGKLAIATDGDGARTFASDVDAGHLAGIVLVKVEIPTLMNSDRNRAYEAAMAKIYGADEQTERLALISFGPHYYAVGFTLLRFGDTWKISSQTSPSGGMDFNGAPLPTTPRDFNATMK